MLSATSAFSYLPAFLSVSDLFPWLRRLCAGGGYAPLERSKDGFFLCAQVFDCRPSNSDLSSEQVVEDLRDVLARLCADQLCVSGGVGHYPERRKERTSNSNRQMSCTSSCSRSFA